MIFFCINVLHVRSVVKPAFPTPKPANSLSLGAKQSLLAGYSFAYDSDSRSDLLRGSVKSLYNYVWFSPLMITDIKPVLISQRHIETKLKMKETTNHSTTIRKLKKDTSPYPLFPKS